MSYCGRSAVVSVLGAAVVSVDAGAVVAVVSVPGAAVVVDDAGAAVVVVVVPPHPVTTGRTISASTSSAIEMTENFFNYPTSWIWSPGIGPGEAHCPRSPGSPSHTAQ